MKKKSLHYRVGVLVVGIAVTFVGLVLFIVGSAFDGPRARYFIPFEENVKGMVIGSKVNFQGVPIGAVTDMSFRTGSTSVEITVDPRKAVIQEVTRARLDRLLVTGQVTVELEGWEDGAKPLRVGSVIEPKDDPLNQLKSSLPELVEQLALSLQRVDRLLESGESLLGPENRAHIRNILEHADHASETLPARLETTLAAVDEMLVRARNALEVIGGDEAYAAVAAARRAAEGLIELEAGLAAATGEATQMLAGVRGPLQSLLLAARESLRDVRGLARKLDLAPTSLLFGVEESEIRVPASPGGSR